MQTDIDAEFRAKRSSDNTSKILDGTLEGPYRAAREWQNGLFKHNGDGQQSYSALTPSRPRVAGKFFFAGEDKLYIRGVTYGTFRPNEYGEEFPSRQVVDRDFAQMAAVGVNAVRTYTAPPIWLLDLAERHGLWVMAGLPVERSVSFIDYRRCADFIEERVRTEVHARAGHRAVLCYTIGNEIPASIVRWLGCRRVEKFLRRLCDAAKSEDPGSLVTYVNYPSTEYLQLSFLDFACFNVYLENRSSFDAYIARLHNIAGNHPLVMAEMGLDSLRHGEINQARTLDWQIRTSFDGGCAGVFVYAWTDEWFRGGADVEDWKFGVTDRNRRPKRGLATVERSFRNVPFKNNGASPRVSVVVCCYNEARNIGECLGALQKLEYPDYEVIVVDDGSTDDTAAVALKYNCRVIRTENCGLSSARNTGLDAASGDIVAYVDADAYPDPHWLHYLVLTFLNTNHAGVGGPNIPPLHDGPIAQCVARSPGGPTHVLLSDREAEHIPGCNMAFRKSSLRAIGGFDPQFRVAGDDVDVCWRLQQQGRTLGFSPAAVVWHHRRNSIVAYWRQQKAYGKAEALLEKKWPEKYNVAGHLRWRGRMYGVPFVRWRSARIYHGKWGLSPFQSLYEPAPALVDSLPTMPEWYLLIAVLGILSSLGFYWSPLRLSLLLFAFAVGASFVQAIRGAARIYFSPQARSRVRGIVLRILTAWFYLLQPLARLRGRLAFGLTLWRNPVFSGFALPRPWLANIWSNRSMTVEQRLESLKASLRSRGAVPVSGGEYDHWDLEVRGGLLGSARLFTAVEHHGDGRQLLRIRSWPRCSIGAITLSLLFTGLSIYAAYDGSWTAFTVMSPMTLLLVSRTFRECAAATAAFLAAVRKIELEEKRSGRV